MRLSAFIILVLSLIGVAANANPPEKNRSILKLSIQCVFRYTTITDCGTFKEQFLANERARVSYVDSPIEADLELSVTDITVDANDIGYIFTWTSHIPGTVTSPWELPVLELPTAFQANTTLSKLINAASRGLFIYYTVVNENTDATSGVTTVTFASPYGGDISHPTHPSWIDRLAGGDVYFNVQLNANSASSGSGGYNMTSDSYGPFSFEGTYMSPHGSFKVDVTGAFSDNSITEPDGEGGRITGYARTAASSFTTIYQISDHWDVAVLSNGSESPSSNINYQDTTMLGTEWALVPFRETQNKELSLRVAPEYVTMNLEEPNYLGHTSEHFLGVMAQIYCYWVTFGDKLILSANATAVEGFKYSRNYNLSTAVSARYQVNRAIGFFGSVMYSDQPTNLTYPGNPDFSNPLQTQFLNGAPGRSVYYSLGVQFSIGNVSRFNKDRRWKTN